MKRTSKNLDSIQIHNRVSTQKVETPFSNVLFIYVSNTLFDRVHFQYISEGASIMHIENFGIGSRKIAVFLMILV